MVPETERAKQTDASGPSAKGFARNDRARCLMVEMPRSSPDGASSKGGEQRVARSVLFIRELVRGEA